MNNEARKKSLIQMLSLIPTHAFASLVAFVFGIVAFWWFLGQPFWKHIFSLVFGLAYFAILFTRAKKIAVYDCRSYSVTSGTKLKGLRLALFIAGVSLAVYLLYRMAWRFMSVDGYLYTATARLYQSIFAFWNFSWYGMLPEPGAAANIWQLAVYIAVPFASVFLGYIAGLNKFDVMERILPSIYEKDNGKV